MTRYIETNGKKYPVKYGFNAYMDLCRMLNMKFSEVESIFSKFNDKNMGVEDFETVGSVVLAGFREGARKEKTECPVETVEDVFDLFDGDNELFAKVVSVFHESQVKPDPSGGAVGKRKPRKK